MATPLEIMTLDELEIELKQQEEGRHNFLRYVQICEFLGVEPNIPDLYEREMTEQIYWEDLANSFLNEIEEAEKRKKYLTFLKEVNKVHIDNRSFKVDIGKKRELIVKYFPEIYGDEGREPLYRWDDYSAGGLFRWMKQNAISFENQ